MTENTNETGIRNIDPYALLDQIRSTAGYKQSSNQSPTVAQLCDDIQTVLHVQDTLIEQLENELSVVDEANEAFEQAVEANFDNLTPEVLDILNEETQDADDVQEVSVGEVQLPPVGELGNAPSSVDPSLAPVAGDSGPAIPSADAQDAPETGTENDDDVEGQ